MNDISSTARLAAPGRRRFLVSVLIYRTLTVELAAPSAEIAAEVGRQLYLNDCEPLFNEADEQVDAMAEELDTPAQGEAGR